MTTFTLSLIVQIKTIAFFRYNAFLDLIQFSDTLRLTLDLGDQAAKMDIFQKIIDKSKSLRKEPTAYFSKEIFMSYNQK